MRRAFKTLLTAALLALTGMLYAPHAAAQGAVIVVEVNEDIITNYDVEQRARLMAFASGGQASTGLRAKAIDALIDDSLKLQEAARFSLEITEAEIDQAIADIAKRNKATAQQLLGALKNAGVDAATFRHQLKAELAWSKIIRGRYGDRIKPSEGEIEAAMANSSSPNDVYQLKQIVIPLQPNAPQEEVVAAMTRAQEAKAAMTSCSNIDAIAASYGPNSGTIPPVTLSKMPGPIRGQVASMDVGQIAEPIRSNNGVHLIMVCGIERKGGGDPKRIEARLRNEKGARISAGYLADLRREALITRNQ